MHIQGRLGFIKRITDYSTQVPIDCDHRDRQTDRDLWKTCLFYELQKIEISQVHHQENRQTDAIKHITFLLLELRNIGTNVEMVNLDL